MFWVFFISEFQKFFHFSLFDTSQCPIFKDLVNNVKYSVVRILLNFDSSLIKQSNDEKKETNIEADNKVGRNSPCPCGSGKKYKKCHG